MEKFRWTVKPPPTELMKTTWASARPPSAKRIKAGMGDRECGGINQDSETHKNVNHRLVGWLAVN